MAEMDVAAQVAYWQDGALEDWVVAWELIDNKRVRHGLFFGHLAMEKILKAHVAKVTRAVPPRIHNLLRLCELAEIQISPDMRDILQMVNEYNIEGRYAEGLESPPTVAEAKAELSQAKEVFEWLIQKL